ncbi:glucose-1-phosphate adenylyltransferase [Paenibacillus sp. UNCCL117]|uniref:glucose-1-phosphate adenylyltransferase n=1 Tax=unclassified Paenibacillus TaxID=185978 RepID=UPI0008834896|nr:MULTISPECIES: glucose-1-phosphate adenylyltransferase [unclassified Paenibacillus]SDE08097.1 glucose-1-phosphate adenylyltransferase [Paenibacillus sp. cl123]SFW59036.1 glucose-1-phosphate adenylyltransferase [Paenibacillus sp. UNCCL117]
MQSQSCVAILLAGGEGRRLGVLTQSKAKPAVHFGGEYRIIDFALSNCANSGISTIGVVTQYQASSLHKHIGTGKNWTNRITLLPPKDGVYSGTADAVYKNFAYLQEQDAEDILVLSGDHIYQMDYRKLLERHRQSGADATIAVTPVAWEEAHRFGIMKTNADGQVVEFAEKPADPQSNLASMGIYVFKWSYLKRMLEQDAGQADSSHDFGKDVIPAMLRAGDRVQTYSYEGYWRDVGTVESLWEAHMDLVGDQPKFRCHSGAWPMHSSAQTQDKQPRIQGTARLHQALVAGEATVYGQVERSVVSAGAVVGQGSVLRNCVVMPKARIGSNVFIRNAIIGEGAVIEDGASVGTLSGNTIAVVGDGEMVAKRGDKIPKIYMPIGQFQLEPVR